VAPENDGGFQPADARQYSNNMIILAKGRPVKALMPADFYLEERGTLW
jgi:hypothetical protein